MKSFCNEYHYGILCNVQNARILAIYQMFLVQTGLKHLDNEVAATVIIVSTQFRSR